MQARLDWTQRSVCWNTHTSEQRQRETEREKRREGGREVGTERERKRERGREGEYYEVLE